MEAPALLPGTRPHAPPLLEDSVMAGGAGFGLKAIYGSLKMRRSSLGVSKSKGAVRRQVPKRERQQRHRRLKRRATRSSSGELVLFGGAIGLFLLGAAPQWLGRSVRFSHDVSTFATVFAVVMMIGAIILFGVNRRSKADRFENGSGRGQDRNGSPSPKLVDPQQQRHCRLKRLATRRNGPGWGLIGVAILTFLLGLMGFLEPIGSSARAIQDRTDAFTLWTAGAVLMALGGIAMFLINRRSLRDRYENGSVQFYDRDDKPKPKPVERSRVKRAARRRATRYFPHPAAMAPPVPSGSW